MKEQKRLLALLTITLMLVSVGFSFSLNTPTRAQGSAMLTGNAYSEGEDTDYDGYFNLLVVNVEVDVDVAGDYRVQVDALKGNYDYLWLYDSNSTYLAEGVQNVTFMFNGILIYGRRLDVSSLYWISLYEEGSYYSIDSRDEVPLSETYNWASFDNGATFTGNVYDEGIDTDADGLFNYLQVGIELNVSDEEKYEVRVSGLLNSSYYFVDAENSTQEHLTPGTHVVNVLLYGAEIYASHVENLSMTSWIYLYIFEDYPRDLASAYYLPFTQTYNYGAFETFAYTTGNISDEGVDSDSDGKFDHLLVDVEFNVTEAGNYIVQLESLADALHSYFYVYQVVSGFFDVGTHWAAFTIYGPALYAAQFSPAYVGKVSVRSMSMNLDARFNLPLSETYDYADFESHATLSGDISDIGVDADGDGLFDYLAVGVEINVTEAGRYRVVAQGLQEQTGNGSSSLWDYTSVEDDYEPGGHIVYLNFSGSMLAYRRFSPTHVMYIVLSEATYPHTDLDDIPSASLPTQYDYSMFNTPMTDVLVNFVVYPDGRVCVDGEVNATHMYPENMGPQMDTQFALSTSGNQTTGRANGTFSIPTNMWPFNATSAYFLSSQDNGMLNASLDATMFLPPAGKMYPFNSTDLQLNAAYSDGMLDITLQGDTAVPSFESMPIFNISDVTVLADYSGDEVSGNVTFRTVSGYPLGEVIVYFQGNKSDVHVVGNLTIVYGDYFGSVINATTVEEMLNDLNSTYPGQGEHSIYNATGGLLECTQLTTTRTPLMSDGDETASLVEYDAAMHGNFTGYLATIVAQMLSSYDHEEIYQSVYAAIESAMSSVQSGSLEVVYWHTTGTGSVSLNLRSDVKALWTKALELVPATVPPEYMTQVEAYLRMANASAYALHDFSLNASYSSSVGRLDLEAWMLVNTSQLEDDFRAFLPDTCPPDLHDIAEAFINTTYCELKSSSATMSYINGTADFDATWVLEGDFRAQVNHVKTFYTDLMNATNPYMPEWMYRLINDTEMDLNDLSVNARLGEDYARFSFEGLCFKPMRNDVDHVRFRLHDFFNFTYGQSEPPQAYQRMQLIVKGGANATHTVLLYAPDMVPTPNVVALNYTTMNWQNCTLSSLKDLHFLTAFLGAAEHAGTNYYVPIFSNSTVGNFAFNRNAKKISFDVTGTEGSGFCNLTIPRALLYASSSEWIIAVDGHQLTLGEFNVTENAEYAFIYFEYSHSTHLIDVTGTSVVPEFSPDALPLVLAIACLVAAVVAVKQRRRICALKTQTHAAITAFAARLHQTKA